jgi:hypothetical protein
VGNKPRRPAGGAPCAGFKLGQALAAQAGHLPIMPDRPPVCPRVALWGVYRKSMG